MGFLDSQMDRLSRHNDSKKEALRLVDSKSLKSNFNRNKRAILQFDKFVG